MYSPFLETYPSTELPFVAAVGQEVRLNARMVQGSKYDFQVFLIAFFKTTFELNAIIRRLLSGWGMRCLP